MENDSARGWAMVGVVQAKSAIRVYKEGRTTGKTFGALTAVRIDMSIAYKSFIGIPIKMTPTEDLKLDSLGITLEELMARDKYRWVGLVEWIAESEPSTDKGDSGALVRKYYAELERDYLENLRVEFDTANNLPEEAVPVAAMNVEARRDCFRNILKDNDRIFSVYAAVELCSQFA
ncbi:unnamed protein product [Alternaria alternata]